MKTRVLAGVWVVIGLAVGNGFLDLYVSRGAREYGQKKAEADLGVAPPVSMQQVMHDTTRDGIVAGSLWASGIVLCGWTTIWLAGRRRPSGGQPPARGTGPV